MGRCGGRPIGCARSGMGGVGEGACSSGRTDYGSKAGKEGGVEKFALGEIGFAGGDGDERSRAWSGIRRSDWLAWAFGKGEGTRSVGNFG